MSLINVSFVRKFNIFLENLSEAVQLSTCAGVIQVKHFCRIEVVVLGIEVRGLSLVVAGIPHDVILGGNILVGTPFSIDLNSFSLKRTCVPSVKMFTHGTLVTCNNTVHEQGPVSVPVKATVQLRLLLDQIGMMRIS